MNRVVESREQKGKLFVPFEKGQKVIIKNPGVLEGTIVGPRPADADVPEDQKLYIVRIEDEQLYRGVSLEPEPPPKMERWSAEWNAELRRMQEGLTKWLANKNDRAAWDQFVKAGNKAGIIVPLEAKEVMSRAK
jgi:hypothetical protein